MSSKNGTIVQQQGSGFWIFGLIILAILLIGFFFMIREIRSLGESFQAIPVTTVQNTDISDGVGGLPDGYLVETTGTEVIGETIEGEHSLTVVSFVEGWDSNGKMVAKGTKVIGPALVKSDPNKAHAVAVLVGAEYILQHDSVVWLYKANNDGLRSQYMFFDKITEEISAK